MVRHGRAVRADCSTTYRRGHMYVTQCLPDYRMQGAKRGANAGRR